MKKDWNVQIRVVGHSTGHAISFEHIECDFQHLFETNIYYKFYPHLMFKKISILDYHFELFSFLCTILFTQLFDPALTFVYTLVL